MGAVSTTETKEEKHADCKDLVKILFNLNLSILLLQMTECHLTKFKDLCSLTLKYLFIWISEIVGVIFSLRINKKTIPAN